MTSIASEKYVISWHCFTMPGLGSSSKITQLKPQSEKDDLNWALENENSNGSCDKSNKWNVL